MYCLFIKSWKKSVKCVKEKLTEENAEEMRGSKRKYKWDIQKRKLSCNCYSKTKKGLGFNKDENKYVRCNDRSRQDRNLFEQRDCFCL